MSRPPKFTTSSFCVTDAIENGLSELQELRDEMQSWRDGMEDKLSHTDKYQQVSDACDALDSSDTSIEIDDEDAGDRRVDVSLGSKRRMPRWLRRDNAVAMLSAARDSLEALADELESEVNDAEDDQEEHQELCDRAETLRATVQELEEVIGECEGVEFPGMY